MANESAGQRISSGAAPGAEALETFQETDAVDESFISPVHHESNEHIALLYDSRQEQLETVAPFIRQGLGRGEKCIYVLDENTRGDITDALQDRGVNVEAAREAGELEFLSADCYVAGGTLNPDEQLTALKEVIEEASDTYSGVRVAVEMTCFLDDDLSYDDLVAYEERYNTISEDVEAAALCQYDRQRFPPEIIRDVLNAHPHLIADRTLSHNVQYVPPDVYFNSETSDREVQQILSVTQALAEAEEKLKRQNKRLDQFASMVSHDLRNPLRVAEGNLELALEEPEKDLIESAMGALTRMDDLIEDVLALARQGQPIDEIEEVQLTSVVERCWKMVDQAEADLETEGDLAFLADPDRVQQLVENLFRNAIDHAGRDVSIRVGVLDSGDGFYVADDGPGIPEEERDKVFESGYTTGEDGTGFGLAIVKEIVEAHGWRIDVVDSNSGGARFEISGVELVTN